MHTHTQHSVEYTAESAQKEEVRKEAKAEILGQEDVPKQDFTPGVPPPPSSTADLSSGTLGAGEDRDEELHKPGLQEESR